MPRTKYSKGRPGVTDIAGLPNPFNPKGWYIATRKKLLQQKVNLNEVDPIAVCERYKTESIKIGNRVHDAIEQFLRGKSFAESTESLSNNEKIMVSYFTDWCSRTNLEPLALEEKLESEKLNCGGTPDVIGTFDGGKTLSIVDWKSDSQPDKGAKTRERNIKYAYQLAGYALLYEEVHGVKINKGVMVRATKDLKFDEIWIDNLTRPKKHFKWLREIYKEIHGK